MPRTRRRTAPGYVYHVISRFVDRDWFIESELERTTYLKLLGSSLRRSDWRCLAYAVMSNHIHLALVAGDMPLGEWMRRVHSPFADWLNRSRDRIGPIFTRGPKSILVPEARVGHLIAYIHNNPVRARVVAQASESTWTSHRSYVGAELAPHWLHVNEGLRRAGVASTMSFDTFVATTTLHPVLGPAESDEEFWQRFSEYEIAQEKATARLPSDVPPIPALDVVVATAEALGLTVEQLRSARRSSIERRARVVAIECARRVGVTTTELAESLRITPQAIRKTCLRAERGSTEHTESETMVAVVLRSLEATRR